MLANTSIKIVLKIPFLPLSNIDIGFTELKKLIWRFYTIAKGLSTTSRIELINKKEFARVVLDKNSEIFVMYISTLKAITIYLSLVAQITTL